MVLLHRCSFEEETSFSSQLSLIKPRTATSKFTTYNKSATGSGEDIVVFREESETGSRDDIVVFGEESETGSSEDIVVFREESETGSRDDMVVFREESSNKVFVEPNDKAMDFTSNPNELERSKFCSFKSLL